MRAGRGGMDEGREGRVLPRDAAAPRGRRVLRAWTISATFVLAGFAVLRAADVGAADAESAAAPRRPASAVPAPAPHADEDWHALNHTAALQARARDYAGLHATLVRLAPALPGSPTVVYNLAASAARLGHVEEALTRLALLADAGLSYDLAADDDFAALKDRPEFFAIGERLRAARRPVGRSTHRFVLAGPEALPESLAWDATGRRLFVSGVRQCEIRVFDDPLRRPATSLPGRRFARLPSSVFALGLDVPRGRLWATVATVPHAAGCGEGKPAAERTALVALDLHSGRVVQRVDAGVPAGVLGDLLVSDDGTVFVTESVHGAVLRLRPGARALDRIDIAGDFASPQTPALSADGRTLVVPDYVRGLATIELGACPCPSRWPANGAGVFTAGIDGLVRDGSTWLAVQNGTTPRRVIRFSEDLAHQRILESGTPGLGDPTHAIVVGRSLWFIADVGWDSFDDAGHRKPGVPPARPELRILDLDHMPS